MSELSLLSRVALYVLMALLGMLAVVLWGWQIMVLRGKRMKNPDGSYDDWHQQKTHYGHAFADVVIAAPACLVGIALILYGSRWGYYLLAQYSFWAVWGNVMTTATSLKFENPTISLGWFLVFPFGSLVGLAYVVWTVLNFDTIYLP